MNLPKISKQEIQSKWAQAVSGIKSTLNINNDLEPQDVVEDSIRSGVTFRGSQLLVLIFAIFIASLGLNTNSIPVIIGAMLISPLMGPIIGMGLAIGTQDFDLLRRGLKNISLAIIGSLIASALYFLISPQYEGSSQLLARTSPSIYDVFIALFGGAAGIVSIAVKNKGQVMPGVAIATSLMPPLCTAGYGLATLQAHFFFGALYLFFTNMIFIMVATWIGVKVMGFKNVVYQNVQRSRRIRMIVTTIVIATVGLSCYLTFIMINKSIFLNNAANFVETEMNFPNTQVLNHSEYIVGGKKHIDVTLIGESLPKDSLQLAMMNKLDSVGLGGTILQIKQGFAPTDKHGEDMGFDKFYSIMQTEIASSQNKIDSLKDVINNRTALSALGVKVAPEIKVLFPTVRDIAMSQLVAVTTDSISVCDTINMAFIYAPVGLNANERMRLTEYLQVRFNKKAVHLTINPANFPWPSAKKVETKSN